jgi:hypothetical protein
MDRLSFDTLLYLFKFLSSNHSQAVILASSKNIWNALVNDESKRNTILFTERVSQEKIQKSIFFENCINIIYSDNFSFPKNITTLVIVSEEDFLKISEHIFKIPSLKHVHCLCYIYPSQQLCFKNVTHYSFHSCNDPCICNDKSKGPFSDHTNMIIPKGVTNITLYIPKCFFYTKLSRSASTEKNPHDILNITQLNIYTCKSDMIINIEIPIDEVNDSHSFAFELRNTSKIGPSAMVFHPFLDTNPNMDEHLVDKSPRCRSSCEDEHLVDSIDDNYYLRSLKY